MSNTKPPVTELLQKASHWEVRNENMFEVFTSIWSGSEFLAYMVPDRDLTDIHVHLPIAMRAMAEELATATSPAVLPGRTVEQTLSILKSPPVRFMNTRGLLQEVLDITDLRYGYGFKDKVLLTATTLRIGMEYVEDIAVPFVYRSVTQDHMVLTEELDTRYPGWKERWKLGQDLELPQAVYLPNVFSSEPVVASASMSTITFGDS